MAVQDTVELEGGGERSEPGRRAGLERRRGTRGGELRGSVGRDLVRVDPPRGGVCNLALAVAAYPVDGDLQPAEQRQTLRREGAGYDVAADDDRVRPAHARVGQHGLE